MAHYGSHSMKSDKMMSYGHGNKKIGIPTKATAMKDGSEVKPKTSGGKSSKSATSFKTY